MSSCRICTAPLRAGQTVTCGDSYCSEADHCLQAAKAARGKKRVALTGRAAEIDAIVRGRGRAFVAAVDAETERQKP